MAVDAVAAGSLVLDVGCAVGHVGEELKRKGCRVVGVEPDGHAAARARGRLDEVVESSAQRFHREELLGSFDAILLLDVIEHTPEPAVVLNNLMKYLNENGFFLISVPNIAHWSTRLMLFRGDFTYENYGIMDNSHLRFFTLQSLLELLGGSGLGVEEIKYSFWPGSRDYRRGPLGILRRLGLLVPLVKKLGPRWPGLLSYQFLVKAVVSGPR